ncbi:MAG: hypothetical protein M0Z52_07305 [Actinomycetota bacterium]|nr:hypothetical protein [Actinomycetota bacterium]
MDMGSAGSGAGGGLLMSLVAWFGLTRLFVSKETCTACKEGRAEAQKLRDEHLERIETKLDRVLEKLI